MFVRKAYKTALFEAQSLLAFSYVLLTSHAYQKELKTLWFNQMSRTVALGHCGSCLPPCPAVAGWPDLKPNPSQVFAAHREAHKRGLCIRHPFSMYKLEM